MSTPIMPLTYEEFTDYPAGMIKPKTTFKVKPVPAQVVTLETSRVITPMRSDLVERIDKEWHRRELPSRSATIRLLIEEALGK